MAKISRKLLQLKRFLFNFSKQILSYKFWLLTIKEFVQELHNSHLKCPVKVKWLKSKDNAFSNKEMMLSLAFTNPLLINSNKCPHLLNNNKITK